MTWKEVVMAASTSREQNRAAHLRLVVVPAGFPTIKPTNTSYRYRNVKGKGHVWKPGRRRDWVKLRRV